MKRVVKGRVDRDKNFIRVLCPDKNTMYEFAVNGEWSYIKVGDTMPNGFVFSKDEFDEWWGGLPKAEETFALEEV